VVLSVSAKPVAEGARRVVVTPTPRRGRPVLRLGGRDIKKVSDATDGKVGYIQRADMQATGLNEFASTTTRN